LAEIVRTQFEISHSAASQRVSWKELVYVDPGNASSIEVLHQSNIFYAERFVDADNAGNISPSTAFQGSYKNPNFFPLGSE
jgi:hypothetical protein